MVRSLSERPRRRSASLRTSIWFEARNVGERRTGRELMHVTRTMARSLSRLLANLDSGVPCVLFRRRDVPRSGRVKKKLRVFEHRRAKMELIVLPTACDPGPCIRVGPHATGLANLHSRLSVTRICDSRRGSPFSFAPYSGMRTPQMVRGTHSRTSRAARFSPRKQSGFCDVLRIWSCCETHWFRLLHSSKPSKRRYCQGLPSCCKSLANPRV